MSRGGLEAADPPAIANTTKDLNPYEHRLAIAAAHPVAPLASCSNSSPLIGPCGSVTDPATSSSTGSVNQQDALRSLSAGETATQGSKKALGSQHSASAASSQAAQISVPSTQLSSGLPECSSVAGQPPAAEPLRPGHEVQQHIRGRTEKKSISTLVRHEDGLVSLRDDESWNWMMWVLHDKLQLSEEELCSREGKWKLAKLLPQYGAVLTSAISADSANRRALEAANIQQEQTSIAKDSHSLNVQQSLEHRQQQQTKRMLVLCGDCLISGLVVMGASLTWTAWQQGLGRQLTASCSGASWIPPAGFLGIVLAPLHPAINIIGHVFCYAKVLGGWLLGMMACALVGWIIQRSTGLHDYHKTPILSMVLFLMLACGYAGWYSLGGLGGHQPTWLACWESWIFLHLLAVCYPIGLSNLLSPSKATHQPAHQPPAMPQQHTAVADAACLGGSAQQPLHIAAGPAIQKDGAAQGSEIGNAAGSSGQVLSAFWQHCKKPLFCIFMGLMLPAVTGWLPCQIGLAQHAPIVAFQQHVPPAGMDWVDIPLEPHW
ncbi:hypothetical protein WJX74_005295 [Apatococcus lobatus]|uniref:Uncharacterized protein n=1 Tax=Apatococcus lobatus TaxID=904363 RepID=A0AAW1QID8_9CHLO